MGVGGGWSGPFFGHLPLSKRPCSDFAACKTILLSALSQIFLSNCIQALKIKRKKKRVLPIPNSSIVSSNLLFLSYLSSYTSLSIFVNAFFSLGTSLPGELGFTFLSDSGFLR